MKVKKRTLLLIACLVWGIAGFNILRIGILAYRPYISVLNVILSLLVFAIFQTFIFGRLVKKHTQRILDYEEEKQYFFNFFDGKSFLIMAVMMTGGIYLRVSGLGPEHFIAVFYSGLGAALLLAGILFGKNYCLERKENMKRLLNTAIGYFIAASAAGVFYREFTKWNGFTGKTTLGFVHTHLFVLGMFLFLILALTCKEEHALLESKAFKRFYIVHNIALPFMAGMMVVRGILQVLNVNLTHAADAAISGIAGVSHILITISLILFFIMLKKYLIKEK